MQNAEERKQVLEAVMEEVQGELTIIVHVGANSTRESVELAKHAETVGADVISAVPSIYYRLPEAAVENHWQHMIDSTNLPFIIYNIPQTTGFTLSTGLLAKLAKQDKVIGVKMSGKARLSSSSTRRPVAKVSSCSMVRMSSFWPDVSWVRTEALAVRMA